MTEGYVVLKQSHVDALCEEWGDLDSDPFWQPQPHQVRCSNQGAPFPSVPCGFAHEGSCRLEVVWHPQPEEPTP